MTVKTSTSDAGQRAYLGIARGTISGSDDSKLMQTVDARLLHNELLTGIERPQSYGFNSVPVDPDQDGKKAAEVIVGFVNGNRSHPVVLAEGDRRSRPTGWQKGESGLWHYQGASAKLTATGWKHDAGPNKQPHTVTVGNAVVTIADGKITCQVGGTHGPALVVKADAVYAGGDPDVIGAGSFFPVQTTGGASNKLKAIPG